MSKLIIWVTKWLQNLATLIKKAINRLIFAVYYYKYLYYPFYLICLQILNVSPETKKEQIQKLKNYRILQKKVVQLSKQGKYTEAIDFAEQALSLIKNILQGDWLFIANSLDNLSLLLKVEGRFHEAEFYCRDALVITQRLFKDDHPRVFISLNNLGFLLQAQGKYEEAELYYRDALAMNQRLFKKGDHKNLAISLSGLGSLFHTQGKYQEAEFYYRDALAMLQKLFNKQDHPNIATTNNNLGLLLQMQGKYQEAELYCLDALTMLQKLFKQQDHSDVANSLNNLGSLLEEQGKYQEAEPYYRDALAMLQKLFKQQDHPDVANSLNNLGFLLQKQGRYQEAKFYVHNALVMRQRLFAGDHLDVAASFNTLGFLVQAQGRYQEAALYFQDALAMGRRLFDYDHPSIAVNLNNLGSLLEEQGKYQEAELYYRDALAMNQRLFNKGDHKNLVISLSGLGSLLHTQGKYQEAELYHRDALAMNQRLVKGEDHLNTATSFDNLGRCLNSQGRYQEAELYYRDALAMLQRLFQEQNHSDLAKVFNNLGLLLQSQGKYQEAEIYHRDGLTMLQRLFKEQDNLNIAASLNNLGFLLQKQGKYLEAETNYHDGLAMVQRLFSEEHPYLITFLNHLSLLLAATDRHEEALDKFLEAVAVENKITSRVFAFSSEADRLRHLNQIRITTNALLSLVVTHFQNHPEAIQSAFDVILQRKSLSAAAVSAFNSAIYEERYQHLSEQLQQWRSLGEQIVYLTFNQDKPEDRKHLAQLTQEADRLEKYLASQVSEIQLKDQAVNRTTVAEKLPSGSVLIEFVRFSVFDFKNSQWNSPRYLVFILPAGQPDKVEMKVLGEAKEIEALVELSKLLAIAYVYNADGKLQLARFDGEKLSGIDFKRMSQIRTKVEPEKIPSYHYIPTAAIQLRQKIFDPIREHLENSQQIFIAPDASLSLVPFGILPLDETGQELLGDRYKISYLFAARDLFRSTVTTNRPASSPKIIADPKFLLDPPPVPLNKGEARTHQVSPLNKGEVETNPVPPLIRGVRGDLQFDHSIIASETPEILSVLDQESLSRAETTGLLAQKVAAMLEVEPHLQEDALVTHLDRNQCPSILLIGTHGLYFPLSEAEQNSISSSSDRLSFLPQAPNPMVRSGLAFAGASNWRNNLPLPPEAGNGFLMAQDVAQLDLWANEITVLLACNSAVGDVHQGEGVFGLRRAFAVAGTKTLVMSLWSVPEKASTLLMERFFNNLRDRQVGRGAALQEAQNYIRYITVKELRQTDLGLAVLRELTGYSNFNQETTVEDENYQPLTHPFYWGAWICQGETETSAI